MATEASPSNDTDPWYAHPVYARYWQHYSQAMAWMQSHQRAYRRALESYFYSPWCFPHALHPSSCYADPGRWHQPFSDHRLASQDSYCTYTLSKESGRHPHGNHPWVQASAKGEQALSSEEEMVSESDEEVECDLSNMEITEELRQYFAQTERHREERRRQQQLDAERLNDYVNADHDLYYVAKRSTEPPSERPGERRQAEMKQLYGASAAKIQAMEAAVQLSFNKHCDLKRPKYWPVIPLKF